VSAPSRPAALIATVFGIGRLKPASGTWASLAALPAAWALLQIPSPTGQILLCVATLAALGLGIWATQRYAADTGRGDPGAAVIDEVAGQWLALWFAQGAALWHFALGFALFRLFDIAKPWPVNWAQDRLPGGWGIMMDDIVAGLYAGALLYVAIWASEQPYVLRLLRGLV
jgi:phosphatidylglycerophosphatase A